MTTAYEVFEKQYISKTKTSKKMYKEARQYLAGGVAGNAAFRRPYPIYMKGAKGARIWDVDDNEYIDILAGGGPIILGHSPDPVVKAVRKQLEKGTVTLLTSQATIDLAKKITQHVPGMEMARFINSGSEAVHMALRAARAFTGRQKHAKIEGNYHGQLDNVLISGSIFAGPEDNPERRTQCAGIPDSVVNDVIVLPFHNTEASVSIIKKHAKELAAVLLEPVAGNYLGGIPADKSYVEALRKVCDEEGIIFIWDEIITGFRLGLSGATSLNGVIPDLRAMGKIIGGGFPIGCYGGRKDIMEKVVTPLGAPRNPEQAAKEMYLAKDKMVQTGTFSGYPIAAVAGLATIQELEKPGFYDYIDGLAGKIKRGLEKILEEMGIAAQVGGVGSFLGIHFSQYPVRKVRDIPKGDMETASAFYLGLVANDIFIPPVHGAFTYAAHTDVDVKRILEVSEEVLRTIKKYRA